MEKSIGKLVFYFGKHTHIFYPLPSMWIEKYHGEPYSIGFDWLWFSFMVNIEEERVPV